jgi:hypothetical protein
LLVLRSFVLTQKNQKVKNPESLIRAVFFPPRLGVDLASGLFLRLIIIIANFFYQPFFFDENKLAEPPEK